MLAGDSRDRGILPVGREYRNRYNDLMKDIQDVRHTLGQILCYDTFSGVKIAFEAKPDPEWIYIQQQEGEQAKKNVT